MVRKLIDSLAAQLKE